MPEPINISYRNAEAAWWDRDHSGEGSMVIDGRRVDYWASESAVWFYEPGECGENTIARFEVSHDFTPAPNHPDGSGDASRNR